MIKIGLIGCGHWGPNYIRAFQRIKGTSIVAACDLDKKKTKFIKAQYSNIEVTNDPNKIIKDDSIDVIIVATPAKTHYKIVKEALKHKKHVLVEKPLTIDVKEASELIKLANRYKRILMPGHIFEHHDGILKLKEYVSFKKIGKVYYLYSRRTNLGPIRNDVNAIWDLALHDISIFNFILGKSPLKVSASGFSYLRDNIEDVGFITLYYSNNIVAHIHVSWLDPRKIRDIVVVGNKKMLIFNDLDYSYPIKVYDKRVMKKKYERPYHTFEEFKMIIKDGQVNTPKVKIREPLLTECEHFIDSVKKNKSMKIHLKRGLDVVKILVTAKKSISQKGKPIKL